jgi:molecular chaperone GrpE (heat shock protein)
MSKGVPKALSEAAAHQREKINEKEIKKLQEQVKKLQQEDQRTQDELETVRRQRGISLQQLVDNS